MTHKAIPFRHYSAIRNYRDAIVAYILAKAFEFTGRVVPAAEDHLLAIGCVFFMTSKKSHIWGSSVMSRKINNSGVGSYLISASHGKNADYLRSLGHDIF